MSKEQDFDHKPLYTLALLIITVMLFSCQKKKSDNAPEGLMSDLLSNPESAVITNPRPCFSWIVAGPESMQTAYQIIVASDEKMLEQNRGDIWDSGKVESDRSISIPYAGAPLKENTAFWWKVRTWDQNGMASDYSNPQKFNTGIFSDSQRKWPGESRWVKLETDGKEEYVYENRHPVRYHEIKPVSVQKNADGHQFVTFERAAFGALKLTVEGTESRDTVIVHLGEDVTDANKVNKNPGGSIIYNKVKVALKSGQTDYLVEIPRFISHYPNSQVLAEHMPEVTSFRYVEIEGLKEDLTVDKVSQMALQYQFDDTSADFQSSNEKLNQIWELCKHTLKVTPFMGVYIDGGARERMPYEADAYMQQVAHYCVDREFAIQRYTTDFLIYNPSWPTEWHLHIVLMAWADYMSTGDARLLERRYDELKKKTLIALAREDGLISTRTGLVTSEFLESIHYRGKGFRDIVDWPQGTPANETKLVSGHGSVTFEGETDRYVFSDINTVVNAFHYRNLVLMGKIAGVLGKEEDRAFYEQRACLVKSSFNEKLLSKETGIYTDGEGIGHSALHANMFPVAFGLAPENHYPEIREFLISRGMACSPGMSLYLFDALYTMGAEDYSLELITNETDRSWMNMIRFGTTVTSEAWDLKYKQNMTWNHAWGAIPAYVFARKICGIEPLEPSFRKIQIKPHPGNLKWAKIKHPTIRGSVEVSFENSNTAFLMNVTIPPNCQSDVYLPLKDTRYSLSHNGKQKQGKEVKNHVMVEGVGPGTHFFEIKQK
ncbi:MAG: alpha-L-rhamnosidase [Bacteroidales bacterium]|nr:alpha-L-rhamnosidase [Bacteroidales bacterium]